MSKNSYTATELKLIDMMKESAGREERQRAEIKGALADAVEEWLATLDEQERTNFFAAIEAATSLTVARKIAKHPDRPDAVDALVADVREKEAQQKDSQRMQRLKDAEVRVLAKLAALKSKYEAVGEEAVATSMKRTKD